MQDAFDRMQVDLNSIAAWCMDNRLKINSTKSQVATVGTNQNRRLLGELPHLTLFNQQLDCVREAKNLGVIFDENMNFLPYLKSVSRRCKSDLFAISRVKDCIPQKILIRTIETTVFPKLYYAASVIHAAPVSYVDQTMLRVVNYAAKMIYGLRKFDHATECRKKLHWNDARTELKCRTQLMAYKLFIEQNPIGQFTISKCRRSHRINRMPKFDLPPLTTVTAKRAFTYRGPLLLNEACEVLNVDCTLLISYLKFKTLLKKLYDN